MLVHSAVRLRVTYSFEAVVLNHLEPFSLCHSRIQNFPMEAIFQENDYSLQGLFLQDTQTTKLIVRYCRFLTFCK